MHWQARIAIMTLGCAGLWACAMQDNVSPVQDGGVDDYCDTRLALVSAADPIAPASIQVMASIERVGELEGIETFAWTVLRNETPVASQSRDPDARAISFMALEPGPYRVDVGGAVGSTLCFGASLTINVRAPGAALGLYRLRLVPAPGQAAPPQEQIIEIPGGADFDLGAVVMASGVPVSGSIQAAGLGGLAAYVRAMPVGASGVPPLEAFSTESGAFSLRVENRDYDVLVVPEAASIAPMLFENIQPTGFSFVLDPGTAVAGVVMDGESTPLEGARVAMRVDKVPSTLATTDASGQFTLLHALPLGPVDMSVVPPDPGALPRLELAPAEDLVLGAGPLTIAYASSLTSRVVSMQVVEPDGATPAASARVTWIGRPMPGAGTLTLPGGSTRPLTGTVRVTHVADQSGSLPAITLPEAVYDVVIEPAPLSMTGQSVTIVPVDLRPGQATPLRMTMGPPALVRGKVQDAAGAALPGVRITATPTGLLAPSAGASASAVTGPDSDGSFVLALPGSAGYELTLFSPDAHHGRARLTVSTPAPGQELDLGAVVLPDALAVTGRLSLSGSGTGQGVIVRLFCFDCAGQDPGWPIAEAAGDATGRFVLAVPDPGAALAPALRLLGP